MEKRVIIFLILSLGILLGYEYLLKEMGWAPQPSQETERRTQPSAPSKTTATAAETAKDAPKVPAVRPTGSQTPAPEHEQAVEIVSDLYRVKLSNQGGVVTSWELLKYRLTPEAGSPPVQLIYKEGQFAKPLALHVDDAALAKRVNGGIYEIERDFDRLDAAHPTGVSH